MEIWHLWIIATVFLFIIEIFVPTFLASCIAIGCITAGILSYFSFGINIQLIAFSVGSIVSFFTIRPFMLKYAYKGGRMIKTNTDALVGKIAIVTVTIDSSHSQGRVKVEGDDWKAEAETNEIIDVGEKVEILKINSTVLIVKQITKN